MKTMIRLAIATVVAVTLSGCVVAPYYGHGPYHRCGYYRCR